MQVLTSAGREKLHRSRDFLKRQADVPYPKNALVLGLDNLKRRTGTLGLFLRGCPVDLPVVGR
jgi:hypothetical protein